MDYADLFRENVTASSVAGRCNIQCINRLANFVDHRVAARTRSDYSARRYETVCYTSG